MRPGGGAQISPIRGPGPRAETVSVKVCPHCAEELPDEATVCSGCHKDPAVVPAWALPRRPDEPSSTRLDDVFGPNRVLPTSDRVPAPRRSLEPAGALGVPSKVWASLVLAWGWGVVQVTLLPWGAGPILGAVGYIAGLILGIMGRTEVKVSDRLGRILAMIAIGSNAIQLVWAVLGYGLVLRG